MTRPRAELLRNALVRLKEGNFDEVLKLAGPLRAANADDVEAGLFFGLAAAATGQPETAASALAHVADLRPDAPHPALDVIGVLTPRREHDAIARYVDAAVAHTPGDLRLLAVAGAWLQQTGQGSRARSLLERVVAAQPDLSPPQIALAAVDAEAGAFDAAITRLRGVLARDPRNAAALANLGAMLGVLNRFDEAEACFVRARGLAPNRIQIAINHGIARLKSGRLSDGWPDLNRRLQQPGHALLPANTLLQPLAADARLDGRIVLVTHDSGFGDTLQFARYLPMLRQRGARVLLWVPKPLHRLLAPMAEVFSDNRAWPRFDAHCPIIRLAEVFATTLETIPAETPYLHADPDRVAHWRHRLPDDGRRRVGIAWAGSTRDSNPELRSVDQRRSLDPAVLAPLFALEGVQWVNLQLGRPPPHAGMIDLMPDVQDFADTAGIVASLDAVVSVDTSVVHLAGGLGKTVLLLDRMDNCWRWLSDRTDSPWYPALTIVRQTRWGDWSGPVDEVAGILSAS